MNYIRGFFIMDVKRMIYSGRWIPGIIGVFLTMQVTVLGEADTQDIMYYFNRIFGSRLLVLALIFCSLPYAGCICEVFEHKYVRLEVTRGSFRRYVSAKTAVCFLTSVITMVMGVLLYVLVNQIFFPIVLEPIQGSSSTYDFLMIQGGFRDLLKNKYYMLYFGAVGLQFGLLAGLMSVCSMYFSLFLANKLLVFSLPVLIYYYAINYMAVWLSPPDYLAFHIIFKATYGNVWENDTASFLWAVAVSLILSCVLNELLIRGVRSKVANE